MVDWFAIKHLSISICGDADGKSLEDTFVSTAALSKPKFGITAVRPSGEKEGYSVSPEDL